MAGHEWECDDYLGRVRRRIEVISSGSTLNFAQICQQAHGAFPDTVAHTLGVNRESLVGPGPTAGREFYPHESPGRGEWFFTESASRLMASRAVGRTLLLGVPTVAEYVEDGLLVDSSPYIEQRFSLGVAGCVASRVEDVSFALPFDSILLDPPWYGDALVSWLGRAAEWVKPGGNLVLALFGELTRPSALAERKQVLETARGLGNVELVEEAISYQTPAFEANALQAAGLPPLPSWRRADLLAISGVTPRKYRGTLTAIDEWEDYQIGVHVLCIRKSAKTHTSNVGPSFKPILPDGTWVSPSVSRRSPALQRADIWSSQNAVAGILDWPRVERAIHEFHTTKQVSGDPEKLISTMTRGGR